MSRTSEESTSAELLDVDGMAENMSRMINWALARERAISNQDSDVINAQIAKRTRFFRT